jgi:hypothetical protein
MGNWPYVFAIGFFQTKENCFSSIKSQGFDHGRVMLASFHNVPVLANSPGPFIREKSSDILYQ